MKKSRRIKKGVLQVLLLMLAIGALMVVFVNADPTGTSITYNVTDSGASASPSNRTDDGGTITTLVLNAVQQNNNWKAYLGNITGALTLDDSAGNTIFDWTLSAAGITGEIYVSRASSITWSSINCTTIATVGTEETALGMAGGNIDSIRSTFNESIHPEIVTAGRTMPANTCNATSTFVSDAREDQSSAMYPEVLMHDGSNLVYATPLNQDQTAFDGSSADFQLIVADDVTAASTTYYFYAEISG